MKPKTEHPFGLTDLEVQALDAVVKHGDHQGAGAAIGIDPKQVGKAIERARLRMDMPTKLHAVLKWVEQKSRHTPIDTGRPRTNWKNVTHCPGCHGLGFVQKETRA